MRDTRVCGWLRGRTSARCGRWVLALGVVWASVAIVLSPTAAGAAFDDVAPDVFYADAVAWLVDQEITTGTSTTTYSPEDVVTRGQMAAFLARFGRNVGGNTDGGFLDVLVGTFYTDPVAWLVARGITTGTSATTYSPDDPVTRGQMAAFLWRFGGRVPAVAGTPFVDVDPAAYYAEAVAWLVAEKITTGTSGSTYSPNALVTRGQMAAFLWRMAGRPSIGSLGAMRTAAHQIPPTGATIVDGGITLEFSSLSSTASARVELLDPAEFGGRPAASAGDPVQVTLSEAALTGPATITVPVTDAVSSAKSVKAYALLPSGVWSAFPVAPATSKVGSTWVATFDFSGAPALSSLALASQGLRLQGGEADFTSWVLQVVAEPATVEPPGLNPYPNGSMPKAMVGVPISIEITGFGGTTPYASFTAPPADLPPGLSLNMATSSGNTVGVLAGTPNTAGHFYFFVTLTDGAGATAESMLSLVVEPPGDPHSFSLVEPTFSASYPVVTPSGSHIAWGDRFSQAHVHDAAAGTTATVGGSPNRETYKPGINISDDGRYTAFWTTAGDLQHHDAATDTLTTIANGTWGVLTIPTMSADGRFTFFQSTLTNLTPGADNNGIGADYFVWDRDTTTITRITNGSTGSTGELRGTTSADGRYFTFVSIAQDLTPEADNNFYEDIFIWDRVTNTTTQVTNPATAGPWYRVGRPHISRDGSTLYFHSTATVLTPEADNNSGDDIFMWDRTGDALTRVTNGGIVSRIQNTVSLNDDGRYLAFLSFANDLTDEADNNTGADLFVWDRTAATTTRVTNSTVALNGWEPSAAMSGSGNAVSFYSPATDLTPEVENNAGTDLFIWERATDSVTRVTNGSEAVSGQPIISGDGSTILFYRNGLLLWKRPP